MKASLKIFKQNLRQYFRDRSNLFWSLMFPVILLIILVLIFGGQQDERITMQISLVSLEEEGESDSREGIFAWSEEVEEIFLSIQAEEDQQWLNLHLPQENEDREEFYEQEMKLLAEGERHVVLVIPGEFNEQVMNKIAYQYHETGEAPPAGRMTAYYRPENQLSTIAADITEGIISEISRRFNIFSGMTAQEELLEVSHQEIEAFAEPGERQTGFSMTDYLVAGIIVMTVFSSGMEILVAKISLRRDKGILRRYQATPVKISQFFSGLFLYIGVITVLQIAVVYGVSRIFFDFTVNIFQPSALAFIGYALLVFLALGFLVLSLVDNGQAARGLVQGLFYPLLFLGGAFFTVTGLPGFLQLIVRLNPVTYLINGLRDTLGIFSSPTPAYQNLLVPGIWLLLALVVTFMKFSWSAGRKNNGN